MLAFKSRTIGIESKSAIKRIKAQERIRSDKSKAQFIINLVAMTTGVAASQILSDTRNNAKAARARQMAMYLAYVTYQWPLARIGEAFGRDRTTAGYACRLIEDLRDDRAFDDRLTQLESCLQIAPDPFVIKHINRHTQSLSAF